MMQSAPHICVRSATPADAPMIARAVAMAIGDEVALTAYCGADYLTVLTAIAAAEATQYSWQYGLVAEVSGVVAGAIVGYDGAALHQLRAGTFRVLDSCIGRVPSIADETEAGEYYLDSIGVFPEFRGMGVGRALVAAFCDKAFAEGHEQVGLIVDFDNPDAEKLYRSLGFERVGERLFFGHQMRHLQRSRTIRERVLYAKAITPFQRKVYLALLEVKPGTTISYSELARRIGCRSAQAVGQALKRNPFAPEVPCHRVIAADGSPGGYQGRRDGEQLAHKLRLLAEENISENREDKSPNLLSL